MGQRVAIKNYIIVLKQFKSELLPFFPYLKFNWPDLIKNTTYSMYSTQLAG